MVSCFAWLLAAALAPTPARADDVLEAERVVDRRPFDVVVLKKSKGGETLEVSPLALPGRRVPRPFPSGSLTVRLLSQPGKDYNVAWSDIQEVRLYEQMIISEATSLTRGKKFNEAFDYFALLNRNYKNLPGLDAATARYLQADALAAFQAKKFDQALATLMSLYERNPRAANLGRAVDTVADKILQEHVAANNLRAARDVLDVVEKRFGRAELRVVSTWRSRFKSDADKRIREGAAHLRAGEYRQARNAAHDALAILPGHPVAEELLRRVKQKYPSITIGVRVQTPRELTPRLDSVASLRSARLANRTITELSGYSPEGGVYACPVGRVGLAESGDNLRFSFPDERASGAPYALARWLSGPDRAGRSSSERALGSLASAIAIDQQAGVLRVDLSRAYIRPEALLRFSPLSGAGVEPLTGVFRLAASTEAAQQFVAATPGAPIAEVEERFYTEDDDSLAALARGDIAALDRLMPWQLDQVRRNRGLAVGSYELPTVHVLIPTHRNKLLDNRSLRRALLYAINREKILSELILGGRSELGFQVVSGPFPAGRSLSDPIRYGYNDGVEPRPYDPRLGALLSALSWSQAQRAEHGKEDPADRPFPPLTLAHNSDPIARTACQSIQMQLKAAGVPIELAELSEDELAAESPEFDLRYAELAVWEPLTDAKLLLGVDGLAGRCSDPMVAALKRLDDARNWVEVGEALRGVHALAAGDLPVLPLWQTVNFYAYRRDLSGPPESCVQLYQTIESWKL